MARPAATERGLFYPTPVERAVEIAKVLSIKESTKGVIRLLDPCCGEGLALAAIKDELVLRYPFARLETWGIEIHKERAAKAAEILDNVVAAPFEMTRTVPKDIVRPYSLVFLNPPYDADGYGSRQETNFIRQMTKSMGTGSILALIVSAKWFNRVDAAEMLLHNYENLHVWRFPDQDGPAGFEIFKQVVIVGTKRKEYSYGDWTATHAFQEKFHIASSSYYSRKSTSVLKLPVTSPDDVALPLVWVRKAFAIKRNGYTYDEMIEACQGSIIHRKVASSIFPVSAVMEEVLEPPAIGHTAMLIAGGVAGTPLINGVAIKGAPVKSVETREEGKSVYQRDIYAAHLDIVSKDGHQHLVEPDEVKAYLDKNAVAFREFILDKFTPYGDHPSPEEEAILDSLSKDKKFPGAKKAGLAQRQREIAIAGTRALDRWGVHNIIAEMGFGKALPLDVPVLTPYGWAKMGTIQPGDGVIGADGQSTQVIGVYPQGNMHVYQVTFSDGTSTRCSIDHLWQVNTPLRKWRGQAPRVMSLGQIMRSGLKHTNGNRKYHIPMTRPVQFEAVSLPLHPYLLGILLGDGCLRKHSISLCSADPEIVEYVAALLPADSQIKRAGQSKYDYSITGTEWHQNPVLFALRDLGLTGKKSESKFVPNQYKFATADDRIALLQGLLDTDGNAIRGSNPVEFSSSSKTLADDVKFVAESLGAVVTKATKKTTYKYKSKIRNGQMAHRLVIRLPANIKPFRLPRKQEAHVPYTKYCPTRAIERVNYVGIEPCQCIKVAADDGLFLVEHCIVTHNTRTILAEACLSDRFPLLVTCPPHLVETWKSESESSVPDCKARIIESVGDLEQTIQDYKEGLIPHRLVCIFSHSKARLGPGWIPASYSRVSRKQKFPTPPTATLMIEYRAKRDMCMKQAREINKLMSQHNAAITACQYAFQLAERSGRALSPTLVGRIREAVYLPADTMEQMQSSLVQLREDCKALRTEVLHDESVQRVQVCPTCGERISDKHARAIKKSALHCNADLITWDPDLELRVKTPCDAPLFTFRPTITRRWPLATYVADQHRQFFKLLAFDEAHQSKSKGTQMGQYMQTLAKFLPIITSTGTYFGGTADSIFYLLYRTDKNVRDIFEFDDEKLWMQRYGVMERKFTRVEETHYGRGNARKMRQSGESAKPGLSPAAIRHILHTTSFGRIPDLGIILPPRVENVVRLDLGYTEPSITSFNSDIWNFMLDLYPRWTSSWLQWGLARPNSAFRKETIELPRVDEMTDAPKEIHQYPKLTSKENPYLPKEQWLIDTVRQERKEGRRVVVYLRQTGTRDIRHRLDEILAGVGVKNVTILPKGVIARKRNAWLKKNGGDVLITHPKMVETGMNLQDFGYCTIIFYEIVYSLYTLWQAMSRVWRPGQTKAVRIFFAVYGGTLEEKALARVGKKLMHGQLLYGQEIDTALVEDTNEVSFVMGLISAMKKGEDLGITENTQIFGTVEGTEPGDIIVPAAKPSIITPVGGRQEVMTIEQWLAAKGMTRSQAAGRKRRKHVVEMSDKQMSLL